MQHTPTDTLMENVKLREALVYIEHSLRIAGSKHKAVQAAWMKAKEVLNETKLKSKEQ